jgi:hypothetical protein
MKPLALHNHLAIFDTQLTGYVFFEILNGCQVGWKSIPQIPGTEVDKKVQGAVLNAGVYRP